MSLLGFASNYFLKEDSYGFLQRKLLFLNTKFKILGVLNYFFVYLAVRCASKPEDPTMLYFKKNIYISLVNLN